MRRERLERRAPQAAAGREQRDGLEQVGLARAVGPGQHEMAAIEIERRGCVVAEVAEAEAGEVAGVMNAMRSEQLIPERGR